MAGFLGIGNYAKLGPGVGKDEPQKHSFFLFFELYFRKFWKLIEINMLFFICCIPFFIPLILTGVFQSKNSALFYLSLVPLIGISVLISGLTFILRNFARQENAFLWMDFIDTVKNNWKQSLAIGAIDFVVYFVMIFSISFYHGQISSNNMFIIPFALCVVFVVIFTFMQYYLFVMLITFDLRMKQLLKNAFIFSFAGLGHNIIITLFCGILVLLTYVLFPLSLLLIPFILVSTFGFIIVFNVWPTIKKYMIPEDADDAISADDTSDESIFEDTGKEK
jgi:uncharacterized membrane protein YesL